MKGIILAAAMTCIAGSAYADGATTGMVGGATPPGDGSALLLSTRRMNAIRSIDPVGNLAVVEAQAAGLVRDACTVEGRPHRQRHRMVAAGVHVRLGRRGMDRQLGAVGRDELEP